MKSYFSEELYIESIKTVYSQLVGVRSYAQLATGILVFWIISQSHPPTTTAYIWVSVLLVVVIIDFILLKRVHLKSNISFKEAKNFELAQCIVSIALSLTWASVFMFAEVITDRFAYAALLYLCAIVVIGALTMSLSTRIYLAYMSPQALTISGNYLASVYWPEFLAVFTISALFASSVIRTGRTNFKNTFLLRQQNIGLLADLKEKKEIAEQANVAKTKFLAAASHDLRQPLQSITLLLAVLSRYLSEEKQKQILAKIRDSVSSLSELLDSLLDISKLDAGLITEQVIYFSVSDLLQEATDNYYEVAQKNDLLLLNNVPKDLYMVSDPQLIKRIVSNLMDNAFKYTPSGSVSLEATQLKNGISIVIKDTGIGISEAEQQNIFNEFYQIENPERDRRKGLGLGLAIVKRLVQLLSGNIKLTSIVGEGSCFQIDLPHLGAATVIENTVKPADIQWPNLEGLKVLIVDDEIDVLESMGLLLESWACITISASNSDEAILKLPKAANPQISAIIVDYRLRENKTGLACALEVMVHLGISVPTLVITGETEGHVIAELEAFGYPFLHKPIDASKLATFLANIHI